MSHAPAARVRAPAAPTPLLMRPRAPCRRVGWSVYLVECADGTLYCGATNDLARRLAAHSAGKGARYTRGRAPVRLAWSEACSTRGEALRRELAVKGLSRAQKLRLAGA